MKTKDLWRPFLIIGLTWIAVVLVSWWVIPAWRREPGGFWILLGFAAPGVLSIAKDLIGIWKVLRQAREKEKDAGPSIRGDVIKAEIGDAPQNVTIGKDIEVHHEERRIDTGGGGYFEKEVNTGGGDLTERDRYRDKYEYHYHGDTAAMPEVKAYRPPDPPPADQLPDPGPLPPGSRLPHLRNAVFTGRAEDLLALAKALVYGAGDEKAVGVVQSRAVATGMGGIGKTQLAVEFCYRYGRFFNGVHWLQADQDLEAEVARCGEAMGIRPWPETNEEQVTVTLKAWERGERLVVFDNLEEPGTLREWLPRMGAARVLITARRQHWSVDLGVQARPLGIFKPEESRDLLCELAPRLRDYPEEQIDQIGERLGHLPLALELAGRYLEVMEDTSPEDYLKIIAAAGGAVAHSGLLDWVQGTPTAHEVGLAATFRTSWARLEGGG